MSGTCCGSSAAAAPSAAEAPPAAGPVGPAPAPDEVRARVRRSYAAAAGEGGCGCGSSGGGCGGSQGGLPAETIVPIGAGAPGAAPPEAGVAGPSLGCGNPLPVAGIRPGDVVLDLGSGAGAEVLRAARLAAPGGKAIGLDMTAEMLALSARNRAGAGAANAFFVGGEIEALPLRDGSVDVIVSNCVLNLSPEKRTVFAEAWRVLRPGGRLAVADVVIEGDREPPAAWREDAAGWDGCVRGAMTEAEIRRRLEQAGFTDARLERLSDPGGSAPADRAVPRIASDLILAVKPFGSGAPEVPEAGPNPRTSEPGADPRRSATGADPRRSATVAADGVRPMEPGELPLVERLVRTAGLDPVGLDAPNAAVFVAVEAGEVVGCAGYERAGEAALLRSVAVREDRRGRGWGVRLSQTAIDAALAEGVTDAWLLTETAGPFYLRLGWSDVPRAELDARFPGSPQVRGACPASARAMRRPLAGEARPGVGL